MSTASLAEQLQQSTRSGRPHPKRSLPARPDHHHCSSNRLVTEPSSNTSRTALAIVGAIDSTVILSSSSSLGVGSVFVNTNSLTLEFFSRSAAGPDSTPCVAVTMTSSAPCANNASAAAQIVPPVSIMSSTSTHTRPSTSPTTSCTVTWFATSLSRRLCTIASGAPSRSHQRSATRTRPASGDTTVSLSLSTFAPT